MIIFEKTFPTEKTCKEKIIKTIKDTLSNLQLTPQIDEKDLKLILDEAIINAMEHGNRWNPDKWVKISIRCNETSAELTIGDEGDGFDHQNRNEKAVEQKPADIRGRGILLINKLSKSEWINNGNTLKICIPLNSATCI